MRAWLQRGLLAILGQGSPTGILDGPLCGNFSDSFLLSRMLYDVLSYGPVPKQVGGRACPPTAHVSFNLNMKALKQTKLFQCFIFPAPLTLSENSRDNREEISLENGIRLAKFF